MPATRKKSRKPASAASARAASRAHESTAPQAAPEPPPTSADIFDATGRHEPFEGAVNAELAPRLAGLFAAAGLIAEEEWERAQTAGRKRKSLIDVLRQDAFSISTYSDLLFRAEINPFRGRDGETELESQLNDPIELEPDELAAMLAQFKPEPDALARWLSAAGVPQAEAIAAGVGKARLVKEDVHAWLTSNGLLTPGVVRRFTVSRHNPLGELCALFAAVDALRINGVISPSDARKLMKRMIEADAPVPELLRDAVRAAMSATGEELIERVVAGMSLPAVAIAANQPDSALMALFPETFIRRMSFIPLAVEDGTLRLAMADPLNLPLLTFLRWVTGRWPRAFFAPLDVTQDRIQAFYRGRPGSPAAYASAARKDLSARAGASANDNAADDPDADAAAAPTPAARVQAELRAAPMAPVDSLSAVQLVSSIIESAIELKATDIHLEPRRDMMAVRMRIDGVLTRLLNIPANLVGPVASRIKVLARMDVTERRRPQDGHLTLDMEDRRFDFRIATLPTYFGEKIAIRILDSSRVMTGLADLGMNPAQLEVAARLVRQPYGMILVTGPTGSGKTSTLYAALQELNTENRHLVTIEDPIEYQLDGVNQMQTDPATGLTFSEGLRAILRQDPNVIMVGEIRDPDTAKTAIRAALTGHLVFSTLHTNTAIGAFQALANLGASPYMIGSALTGVIAQRLVRKLCPACKKLRVTPRAMAEQLGLDPEADVKLYRAEGCQECLGTGYRGRIGCFEIIEMTEKLRRQALNDETPTTLLETARAEGRISIRDAGLERVRAGITSPEEAIEKVFLDS